MKLSLLLGTLACLLLTPSISRADEYDNLRLKWRQHLTGQSANDTYMYVASDPTIAAVIDRIEDDATKFLYGDNSDPLNPVPPMVTTDGDNDPDTDTRTYLWSDLASASISSHITSSYARLKAMTLAYKTSGSSYYGNATLFGHIKGGLDWLYTNRYNETKPPLSDHDNNPDTPPRPGTPYDNTWDWRIGVPMAYNDIMVMLYTELQGSPQMTDYAAVMELFTRDTFYTSASSTGANKVWRCMIATLYGAVMKDSTRLTMAKSDLLQPSAVVFDYAQGDGDGFYSDGSCIQHHHHPYTGSYGVVTLYYGAEMLNLLRGSTWEITDSKADNIFDWVYNGFEPLIYKGVMFTTVMGRGAGSYDTNRGTGVSDHLASHKVIWALIRLAEFAPAADAAAFKSLAKHWISADTSAMGFYADVSAEVAVKAKAIVADSAVPNRGEASLYKQHIRMDRVAQQRPGYAFGVSMFSTRIYNYESINNQNLKGWHTGSGATYLHNGDTFQFSGNYWTTVNPYRLPGITTLKDTPVSGHRLFSGQAFVGGTDVADMFGVTAMQFRFPGKTLYAKKSWFMFDDEMVALGADIDSAETGTTVETIIENRKLTTAGNNDFRVNNVLQPETFPAAATHTGVNWAYLAGNVTGADIGYYFPGSATIKSLRESRTDNWRTMDNRTNVSDAPVTDKYLNLWFDHGTGTIANATYAYVLLPNKTSSEVSSYAGNPDITVLENSSSAQAVTENTLGITAINFWQDSPKTVGDVTTSSASSFIMMEGEEILDIGISDPTQLKTGSMSYTIAKSALSLNSALTSSGVTVTQLNPTIQFSVNMQYARGGTKRIAFNTSVVVDNNNTNNTGGSTATANGTWTSSTGAGFWGTEFVHDGNTGKGSSKYFTFTPNIPVSGSYEVGFWYVAHAWRATNVPVDIVSSAGTSTVTVNQQVNGSQWFSLGTYHFNTGTSGRVVVRTAGTSGGSGGNSYVAADAVRFRPVASVTVNVDNNNTNNTGGSMAAATGSGWSISTGAGNSGGNYHHDGNTGKGSGKYFTFTPNLPSAGNYEVFIWHVSHANRATNVPVEIHRSGGTSTVTVNQQINGSQWLSLGTYAFAAGTAGKVVVRTQHAGGTNTNGYVVADGVRFVKQ